MAVIKIPSKHIYSIDNQKVIDNQVDKIEIQVKNVVPDNQYGVSVHNERLSLDSKYEGAAQQDFDLGNGVAGSNSVPMSIAAVQILPTYISAKIRIPITEKNHYIETLILGVNKEEEKNIGLRLFGDVKKGIATNTMTYSMGTNTTTIVSKNYVSFDWNKTTYNQNYENQENYKLDTVQTNTAQTYNYPSESYDAHILVELNNQDNLSIVTATKTNDSYILDVVVLCGLKVVKLGASFTYNFTSVGATIHGGTTTANLNGTYEEYIPSLCEITVYGNTIGIDLQNEILFIGAGDNIMSFNSNELMQKTNTPSIEETYGKIIEQWKNGKEVATIRCGIEDYYGIVNILVNISEGVSNLPGFESVLVSTQYTLKNGEKLYLANGTALTVSSYNSGLDKFICNIEGSVDINYGEQYVDWETQLIFKSGGYGFPMTINIGDTVIPYVYGANGKDKPMSLKKDGTAKEFEVLGKKIIYDGAIWQELTLQEKN